MKGLIQILLLFAVAYLLYCNLGHTALNDSEPALAQRHLPLAAPLLPEFSLTHDKPGWFDKMLDRFDERYKQGESMLQACTVDEIRDEAAELIARENADRPLNLGQLCDLYDAARAWAYLNDPASHDYFANPVESHRLLRGDCDDYAIYLSSLASALGFEADIVVGDLPSGKGHAYPEVCIGPMDGNVVRGYLHDRYELPDDPGVFMQKDQAGNLYLTLERGPYPGARPFNGTSLMRLYLSDQFIEQY